MLQTALHYSRQLLKEVIQPGNHVVDATMGNGNDTLLLAELVGKTGKVYAFDVQEQAIQATKNQLIASSLNDRVDLILDGHENVSNYLGKNEGIQAAVFNLGYLPNSNKKVITLPETTRIALDTLLTHLTDKGRILLVSYYGHDGGQSELLAVQEFCKKLPQEQFNVLMYHFINQKNSPPILFCIEKKRTISVHPTTEN